MSNEKSGPICPDWRNHMGEKEEIRNFLMEVIGEEGCGMACGDADIFVDEDGWKLKMEGFMEPWKIGKSVEEAKESLREYASMRYGLS